MMVTPPKNEGTIELPNVTEPAKSLTKVLGQSEHVNDLVKESAEELSSVNTEIKQELVNQHASPAVSNVLKKSESVENKVQEASDKLAVVNQALKVEIRERVIVDQKLATAILEKEVAQEAALHDALTGLPNRALFNDRLAHGIAQASRHQGHLAVLFVDMDNFKFVNDTYGHDVGDIVLQTTAKRLKDNFRDEDTVSRHGGDEFLCLLTEIQDVNIISMIAEKIIAAMQSPCPVNIRDIDINLNIEASIGISIFPKDGSTAEMLINSADAAMYRAKKSKPKYIFAH
jgi:diguanylate cyclase (GGDEF)-like protein